MSHVLKPRGCQITDICVRYRLLCTLLRNLSNSNIPYHLHAGQSCLEIGSTRH